MKQSPSENADYQIPFLSDSRRKTAFLLFSIFFVILIIAWAIALISAIAGVAPIIPGILDDYGNSIVLAQSFVVISGALLVGALELVALIVTFRFFRDIVKGKSPFDMRQTKRLRNLAIILFAYGILDAFFGGTYGAYSYIGQQVIAMVFAGNIQAGITVESYHSWWDPTINVGIFIAALVVFALSFVFEYGCELQQDSDSFV